MSKRASRRGQNKRISQPKDPSSGRSAEPLTPQESQYLFNYFCVKNHALAARMTGLKGQNKSQSGKRLLTKILRKCSLLGILDELGLDNIVLAKSVWAGLESNITKIATFRGGITDERSYPDMRTRYLYLRFLAELKGLLATPASDLPPGVDQVTWADPGEPMPDTEGPTLRSEKLLKELGVEGKMSLDDLGLGDDGSGYRVISGDSEGEAE